MSPTRLYGVTSTHCDAGVAMNSGSVYMKYPVFAVLQTGGMK
jgi:hypothetical protein